MTETSATPLASVTGPGTLRSIATELHSGAWRPSGLGNADRGWSGQ
jgi:hypothetical protein